MAVVKYRHITHANWVRRTVFSNFHHQTLNGSAKICIGLSIYLEIAFDSLIYSSITFYGKMRETRDSVEASGLNKQLGVANRITGRRISQLHYYMQDVEFLRTYTLQPSKFPSRVH